MTQHQNWWKGNPARTQNGLVKKEAIQDVARQIAEKFKPERVILFGSYAREEATPDSDVDMLVVADSPRGSRLSLDILKAIEYQIPLELIVRTPVVLSERIQGGDVFLTEITTQGKVLYESLNA